MSFILRVLYQNVPPCYCKDSPILNLEPHQHRAHTISHQACPHSIRVPGRSVYVLISYSPLGSRSAVGSERSQKVKGRRSWLLRLSSILFLFLRYSSHVCGVGRGRERGRLGQDTGIDFLGRKISKKSKTGYFVF